MFQNRNSPRKNLYFFHLKSKQLALVVNTGLWWIFPGPQQAENESLLPALDGEWDLQFIAMTHLERMHDSFWVSAVLVCICRSE